MSLAAPPLDPGVLAAARPRRYGRVLGMVGAAIEVGGLDAAIGDAVTVERPDGGLLADVVALRSSSVVCLPLGDPHGVRSGSLVHHAGGSARIRVGPGLLGRVLDGLGRPLDGSRLPTDSTEEVLLHEPAPNPLDRPMISRRMGLGVRVLDSLVPCGRGQRLGILAGSGVGKSSLLSMITRFAQADVCVLALIGERGREVAEFLERDLGEEGRRRSVVVVATSDQPALVRIRSAFVATRIAESFRDQGAEVLLLMDSLTRFAMAQREVGLAAGEPPTTRGYPPSVFGMLPRLLERAGTAARGSITGLYTILVEGDDMNEPIADTTRSILDGHIALSRSLAESGHYPAVDALASLSRVAPAITSPEHQDAGRYLRSLMAALRDVRDLIDIGAYAPGSNTTVDEAIRLEPAIKSFLQQRLDEYAPPEQTTDDLSRLVGR